MVVTLPVLSADGLTVPGLLDPVIVQVSCSTINDLTSAEWLRGVIVPYLLDPVADQAG
jgi:hypothetical protein